MNEPEKSYHEKMIERAREDYSKHVIYGRSENALWLRRPDTVNLQVSITLDWCSALIVTGDISPLVFQYYSGKTLNGAIAWMGSRNGPCGYFMEKARTGMCDYRDGLLRFDEDAFEKEARELFARLPDVYGDPGDPEYEEMKANLDADDFLEGHCVEIAEEGALASQRALIEYLDNKGVGDAWEYVGNMGMEIKPHVYLAWAALNRAHELLKDEDDDGTK